MRTDSPKYFGMVRFRSRHMRDSAAGRRDLHDRRREMAEEGVGRWKAMSVRSSLGRARRFGGVLEEVEW